TQRWHSSSHYRRTSPSAVISGDKCKLAPRGFFGRCKSDVGSREWSVADGCSKPPAYKNTALNVQERYGYRISRTQTAAGRPPIPYGPAQHRGGTGPARRDPR